MVVTKKLYGLLVVLVLAAMYVLLGVQTVYAAGATLDVTTTYEVVTSSGVQVRSIYNITNTDGDGSISKLEIPAPGINISNVRASYQDNDAAIAEYNEERGVIVVTMPRDFGGDGRQWSLVVDYETQLVVEYGNSLLLQIPVNELDAHAITSESISVVSDLDLGLALERGPEPDSTTTGAGKQIATWSDDDGIIEQPLGLVIGENGIVDVEIRTQLQNDTWWWKTVTLTLPPDTNHQKSFIRSITPTPSNVRLDLDGNILVEYNLHPKQSIEVAATAEILVTNVAYPLDAPGSLEGMPQELIDNYTSVNDTWSDRSEVATDSLSLNETLSALYEEAVQFDPESTSTYERAIDRANFFIGNARSNGIPTRLVLGKVFADGATLSTSARAHAWAEVYLPSIGWVTIDPNLDSHAGNFGTADVRRVGLVLRGIIPDFPPERLNNTSLNYGDSEEPALTTVRPLINAQNYIILPGLSLRSVAVTIPDGPIVDNTGVEIADEPALPLGSLAPLQTAHVRSFNFGAAAFANESVAYGEIFSGEIADILQTSTTKLNYVPVSIISILTLSIAGAVWNNRKRSEKKLERTQSSKNSLILATQDDGNAIEFDNLVDDDQETITAKSDTMPSNEPKKIATSETKVRAPRKQTRAQQRKKPARSNRRSKLIQ